MNFTNNLPPKIVNKPANILEQPWFLCLLFAFWFFLIPLVVGIVLLVRLYTIRHKDNIDVKTQKAQAQLAEIIARYEKAKEDEQTLLARYQKEAVDCVKNQVEAIRTKLVDLQKEKAKLSSQIVETKEEILAQSFGLYTPRYDFMSVDLYKAKLERIRLDQREMIKAGIAVTGNMSWTVDGSAAQGLKMVKDMQKLLLRAYNSECDEIVGNVKYNNFDASLKRLTSSYESITKLGKIMNIAVTTRYYDLKVEELHLALDYKLKQQKEKEEQKEIRAQMREEAKLRRELEEERKKLEKEQLHYQNSLARVREQLKNASQAEMPELKEKLSALSAKFAAVERALTGLDYRQANQKAGYVYIISNIGAFGENVFKIGMTRRLDPQERVDELGDASVPFAFDVHAMIFSDNAPALEASLHRAFDNNKLNWVNKRREFFRVSLDDIKRVVRENYDKTVEFVDVPDAEQFRVSEKMKLGTAS